MYDNNPTLAGIVKEVDETKQGQVFYKENPAATGVLEGLRIKLIDGGNHVGNLAMRHLAIGGCWLEFK